MDLFVVAIAGFFASMVDGALGMGFGPTSSSILLSNGLSPVTVSTTVNLAKIVIGLVAGVSHWRFNNIDRQLVFRLAIPGAFGALVGVTVLTNVNGDDLKPYLAGMLILVGLRILVRFSRPLPLAPDVDDPNVRDDAPPEFDKTGVEIAGAAGGVTNGLVGAWGPVVTPFLLHRGLTPRFAVGSVNTAEVAVATVAAGSLIASLDGGIEWDVLLAMLLGGVIAAPIAALSVRHIPARALGLAVAMLLLLTNARELMGTWSPSNGRWAIYLLIGVLMAAAIARPRFMRSATPPDGVSSN